MLIGVPKEIKNHEYRVGLTPASVRELVTHGHEVLVQSSAGLKAGLNDQHYILAGAQISPSEKEIFDRCELVIKVKEPQPEEIAKLSAGQTLFTYLHLAADKAQANALLQSGATAIAYETVTADNGGLPLLSPMSEVAGRMAVQAGATSLEMQQGGSGILLGGVPGVSPAAVTILGAGVAGTNAARMAMGLEAHVTVLDINLDRLKQLDLQFSGRLNTIYSTRQTLADYVTSADLVIGAVLVPGSSAPKLVSTKMVAEMRDGSAIVDIAIDQGGCCETSRPTSHDSPRYIAEGVVHYCVTNMPGAVARSSTFALNNATLPFIIRLADLGITQALLQDSHLMNGLNVHNGILTSRAVSTALSMQYQPAKEILSHPQS